MSLPRFEYFTPSTVDEAVALLASHGDSKVLAGGQSLIPVLAMRLAQPAALVDIGRIGELRHVREEGSSLVIGALVRHEEVLKSELIRNRCPLLVDAAAQIGHQHIRNRGTVGGSLAHADPAAEYVTAAMALDAEVALAGPGSTRQLAVRDFVLGPLTTALAPDELLVEIRVPASERGNSGWSFREMSLRKGDFALAMTAVLVDCAPGTDRIERVRICIGATTAVPVRCIETEARLIGQTLTPDVAAAAGTWAANELQDPVDDIHASGDYRVRVAGYLVRDALIEAWARVQA